MGGLRRLCQLIGFGSECGPKKIWSPATAGVRLAQSAAAMRLPGGHMVGKTGGHTHPQHRPQAVIFDKNGTLIDFHSVWTPWVQSLTHRLEKVTGLDLQQRVFSELDFCHFTKKTRPGLLAHGTSWQIKHELENVLFEAGLSRRYAQLVIEQCWNEDTEGDARLQPAGDLHYIFTKLKRQAVKVAICTSDTRTSTEHILHQLQLHSLVDAVICGNDVDSQPKPSGTNVRLLCHKLGVEPQDVVVVGDTSADMEMGKAAGAGLTIGVLSGIGNRLNLSPVSDLIVNSINEVLPVVLESDLFQIKRKQNVESSSARYVSGDNGALPGKKASLVIFDKDGTLICFHSMWTPWAEALMDRLERHTGLELREKMLEELGYCHKNNKWIPGILAEGTVAKPRTSL